MKSYISILLLVLVASVSATQYVPIPAKPQGISFGLVDAPVLFEAYYDLTCPDSLYSNGELNTAFENPILIPYLEYIQFRIHYYPLPYHYQSIYLGQIFSFVVDQYGKDAAYIFTQKVFDNQSLYYNNITATTPQIKQKIAYDTASYLSDYNVTASDVYAAFSNSTYLIQARDDWKFGAGNAVSGTPTFFVNEVVVNEGYNFDADDWVDFFYTLFNPTDDDEQQSIE